VTQDGLNLEVRELDVLLVLLTSSLHLQVFSLLDVPLMNNRLIMELQPVLIAQLVKIVYILIEI
jgi:hypothetical protein